ncbi:SDR family oxidoreductase [Aeromicrobium fastidiosum]|uniref:SDR family oxidoreductase n=1 Tax=Aeromicrobium fastidiosum TaxID=52699 RepID=A0A641AJL0_9ACTN|nr:SDR family oxidoreductase [Aeromicrobium fastidiosum]KAA1374898.1 SDR family oxidoreductase [Aeromicrobium fastidiosum]MBP2390531.1 NAD(P)-dependent dehydrogenase (short-subunit alcohol dehydrogenase family) [Aeromicrobium fastidiosum]
MRRTTFEGRTAVVTGAASGIGRAAAVLAAQRGARLVLTDRDPVGLARTVELVEGHVVHHEALDITDEDAVAALARRSLDRAPVDVVMNVAGISTWGRIQDLSPQHWRDCVEVDLMGPIHVLSAFVPPMIAAGTGGHVVNVSSAAGLFGLPLHAPYSAAKFGLRGVSEVLRFDLERHDIGVTLVCPGAVRTPLVGTVDIVGVDRDHPAVRRTVEHFERHAVTPEAAAAAMIRGVERGDHLVFTSRDVRLGHLAQRWVPWAYDLAMRRLNRRIGEVMDAARSV